MNNDKKNDFRLDQSTVSNGLFTVIERKPLSSLENNDSLNISNLSDPLNISNDCLSKKKDDNATNDNICEIYRLNSSQILNDNLDNVVSRISYVDDDVSSFYDSEKEEELYFDNDISTLGSCYSFSSGVKNSKKKKSRNSIYNNSGYKNVKYENNSENDSPFNKIKDKDINNEYDMTEEVYTKEDYNDNQNSLSFPHGLKLDKGDLSENKNSDLLNEELLNSENNDEKAIRLNKNIYRIVNINNADKDNKEHFIRRITQIRKSMIKEKDYDENDQDNSKLKDVSNKKNESNVIFNNETKNYKNYNRFSEGYILKKYNNLSRYNSDKKIKYKELNHEEEDTYFDEDFDEYNDLSKDNLYYDYINKNKKEYNKQFKNSILKLKNEEFHKNRRNEYGMPDYHINENIYYKNIYNKNNRLKNYEDNIINNRRTLKDLNNSYSDEKDLLEEKNENLNQMRFRNKVHNNYEEYYNKKKNDDYYCNARIKGANSTLDANVNIEKLSDECIYSSEEKYVKNNNKHYINKKNRFYDLGNMHKEEFENKNYYNNIYNNLTDDEYKENKYIYNSKDPKAKSMMKNEIIDNEQMKKNRYIYMNNNSSNVSPNEELYENKEGNTYFKVLPKKSYKKADNEDMYINNDIIQSGDEHGLNEVYRNNRYLAPNQNFEKDYVIYEKKKYIDGDQNDENIKMKKNIIIKHMDEKQMFYKNNNFIEYNNNYNMENNIKKKMSYGNISNNGISNKNDLHNNVEEKELYYYKERNNLINNNENNEKNAYRNDYYSDKDGFINNYENKSNKYPLNINTKYKNDSYMHSNNEEEHYNKKYAHLKSNDHVNSNYKNNNYEYNRKSNNMYNQIAERNKYDDINYHNSEMLHHHQNSTDYLSKKGGIVYDQYENNDEKHNMYNKFKPQNDYNLKNTYFNENQDQENKQISIVTGEEKREMENARSSFNDNKNNEIDNIDKEQKEKLNNLANNNNDIQREGINNINAVVTNHNLPTNLVQTNITSNNLELLNKQNKDQPPVKKKRGRPKLKKTTPEETQKNENINNVPSYQTANQNMQTANFNNLNNNIINDLNPPLYNNIGSAIHPSYNINTHLNQPLDQQINQQLNQALGQQLNYQLAPPTQALNHQITDPLNQPLNQQINQHINQQLSAQMNQQLNHALNQQMNIPINQQLAQPLNSQLEQQINQQLNQQISHPLNQQISAQLDQQINAQLDQQLNQHLNINLNPPYNHHHIYNNNNNNNNNLNKQLNHPIYVMQNRMNNNFKGNINEEQFAPIYNNYDKEIANNNAESNFYYGNMEKLKNNKDDYSYEDEEESNKNNKRNARSTVSESEEKDSEREFKKIHKKRGRRKKNIEQQIIENKSSNNADNKSPQDLYKNNINNDNSKNEIKTDSGYSTFIDENNKTVSYRVSYHPADAVWEKISGVKFGPMILTAQSRTTNVILSKKRSIELGNILHNLIYGYIYKGDNVRLTIGKESKNVKSGSPFFLPSFMDCSIHNDDDSGSAKIFLCFVYLN